MSKKRNLPSLQVSPEDYEVLQGFYNRGRIEGRFTSFGAAIRHLIRSNPDFQKYAREVHELDDDEIAALFSTNTWGGNRKGSKSDE